jgi:hypothetical protein
MKHRQLRAVSCKVGRRCAQHAPVRLEQRQRHHAGLPRLAEAQRDVDGFPIDVGQAVRQLQLQAYARVPFLERVQPRQHDVAAEVGRHRDLQLALDRVLSRAHFRLGVAQAVQQRSATGQQAFAGHRQAHAARRAHEQRRAEVRLQPFEARAGDGRRYIQQARGRGQAALLGRGHEKFEIAQVHFSNKF